MSDSCVCGLAIRCAPKCDHCRYWSGHYLQFGRNREYYDEGTCSVHEKDTIATFKCDAFVERAE